MNMYEPSPAFVSRFLVNVNEFLTYPTTIPHDVEVEHINGTLCNVHMSNLTLLRIKDVAALHEHLKAAAENNHQSLKEAV